MVMLKTSQDGAPTVWEAAITHTAGPSDSVSLAFHRLKRRRDLDYHILIGFISIIGFCSDITEEAED